MARISISMSLVLLVLAVFSGCVVAPPSNGRVNDSARVDAEGTLYTQIEGGTVVVAIRIDMTMGIGCGTIVARKGNSYLVVTAKHVAKAKWAEIHPKKAQAEQMILIRGLATALPFKIVSLSKTEDLALVSFQYHGDLPVIPLATESAIMERVYGCGYHGSFGTLITEGILSAKSAKGFRRKSPNMWVATAPIMGGCSGGGLFNTKGELLGVRLSVWAEGKQTQHYITAFLPYEIVKKFVSSAGW